MPPKQIDGFLLARNKKDLPQRISRFGAVRSVD
jgi:hypothetical protein